MARTPWSPNFPVQSIEILPLALVQDRLYWLKPVHAESLRVGLPRGVRPAEFVLEVIGWYPLNPIVVHSTSWRHGDDGVVLTYLVVIEPPEALPPNSLVALPVERAELSRGGAKSAPERIDVKAVVEHALRHLAWLTGDDPAVQAALAGWQKALMDYKPEPFRALDA